MNALIKALSITMVAICATGFAQQPDGGQSASATPLPPGKSPAERSATLTERVKFGYESDGWGSRLNSSLHRASDEQLRCMAATGDAGAAKTLCGRLADGADARLTRVPEAEEVALEQYRLNGHTFLIYMTAGRYRSAAEDECGFPDKGCLVGNVNFQKSAAWYRLGEKLGDPVSAFGLKQLQRLAKPDVEIVERDAEALLVKTQPVPDAVETYAYQCRDGQK